MQLLLPIFPPDAKMITNVLGVQERDGTVHYLLNGMPMYAHLTEDLQAFRFITSNFIHMGLCTQADIQRAFHVSEDSVSRAYKKFVHKGEAGFFGSDSRHGNAHKIVGTKRERMQSKLDKGQSVNSIAKEEGVVESAIRYALKQGYLKKKR
jgi:hypothetical protein